MICQATPDLQSLLVNLLNEREITEDEKNGIEIALSVDHPEGDITMDLSDGNSLDLALRDLDLIGFLHLREKLIDLVDKRLAEMGVNRMMLAMYWHILPPQFNLRRGESVKCLRH